MPIPGVAGKTVASKVSTAGGVGNVRYDASGHKLMDAVCAELLEGDLLVTMGAGDVTQMGPRII